MKIYLFSIILFLVNFFSFAQTGIGTSTPDASAKLEVSASNKGFLPPRVTLTGASDNSTIANPATGLLIYNTGNNSGLTAGYYYWSGSAWTTISTSTGTGVYASYMRGSRSTQQTGTISAGTLVAFTQVDNASGADIALNTSTGQITLAPNKTYKLVAQVPTNINSGVSRPSFAWYNETANGWMGSQSSIYSAGDNAGYASSGGNSEAIISINSTTVVSYRLQDGLNVSGLGGNPDFNATGSYPWFEIQVMSGFAPEVNPTIIGDVKTGFQTGDHSGWIKLNGRLKSSLSANQQAQATSLGIGTNLPDATNSFLVQNGTSIGSVSSSNTKTITQANLPNINFPTATTSTNGNHNHTFYHPQGDQNYSNGSGNTWWGGSWNWGAGTAYAGDHNHTVTVSSGGSGTALNITPQSLSINTFIYLGY